MRTTTKIEIVFVAITAVMLFGTLAYHSLEKWDYVDSFYFTGITMTTIGYGDLHPTTPFSKIFTVFFAFGGVGISLFALSLFASEYFGRRRESPMHRRVIKKLRNTVSDKKRRDIIRGSKI